MNVLFVSLIDFKSLNDRNIYTDLMRMFVKNGHQLYVISPTEKKNNQPTRIYRDKVQIEEKDWTAVILKPQIGNIQKNGYVEKAISMFTLDGILKRAIKHYWNKVKFDLILYPTPPITITEVVHYVKKRDGAKTYLLLKDIFPDGTIDLGVLSTRGWRGMLFRYYKGVEKKLYDNSDFIGCMSPANCQYVLSHTPKVDKNKVEICPNSVEPLDNSCDKATRARLRVKYGIPENTTVFVYGGNLGQPQGISFFINCLQRVQSRRDAFFLIVGDGTEFRKIEEYISSSMQKNVKLLRRLPKKDYDKMIGSCDIGMIFLDHRYLIPNFPSRLLSYMQAKMPVLAVTDPNTDLGTIIEKEDFGWWCESNDVEAFSQKVAEALASDLKIMGQNAWDVLVKKYNVKDAYQTIIKHI